MERIIDIVKVSTISLTGVIGSMMDYSRLIDINDLAQSFLQTFIAIVTLIYILRKLINQTFEREKDESQS